MRAGLLVVDSHNRVLLFRGGDPGRPEAGTWWFTPGGGAEAGEGAEAAALRELREETGLAVSDPGPEVLRRHTEFEFDGIVLDQDEVYFLVRTKPFEIDNAGWTEVEHQVVDEHRWWSIEDLKTTSDQVFPDGLAAFLEGALSLDLATFGVDTTSDHPTSLD